MFSLPLSTVYSRGNRSGLKKWAIRIMAARQPDNVILIFFSILMILFDFDCLLFHRSFLISVVLTTQSRGLFMSFFFLLFHYNDIIFSFSFFVKFCHFFKGKRDNIQQV